jgi:AcrR family transcriptional regulator
MLEKNNVEGLICSKFLDLMDTKPFYKIKVTEFAQYADIGRSTFYLYFDSIYSVVQKIEDDFIAGLGVEEDTSETAVRKNFYSAIRNYIRYIKPRLRTVRILTGPNGDSGFEARLYRQTLSVCQVLTENESTKSKNNKDVQTAFIAGGIIALLKYWANHENSYTEDDIYNVMMMIREITLKLLQVESIPDLV